MTPALAKRRQYLLDYADLHCTTANQRKAFFSSFALIVQTFPASHIMHITAAENIEALKAVDIGHAAEGGATFRD